MSSLPNIYQRSARVADRSVTERIELIGGKGASLLIILNNGLESRTRTLTSTIFLRRISAHARRAGSELARNQPLVTILGLGRPGSLHAVSIPFDSQGRDFRGEGGRAHAQQLSGTVGPIDFAATLLKRFYDAPPFEFETLLPH